MGNTGKAERRLEVDEHDIGIEDFEGFYTEHTDAPTVGIERSMCRDRREALVLEAESIVETRIMRSDDRELFFTPTSYETMCRRRIRNLRKTIEDTRPDWVEAIRDASRVSNNVYVIVAYAGLDHSPYPAVAIVENLVGRGEIFATDEPVPISDATDEL